MIYSKLSSFFLFVIYNTITIFGQPCSDPRCDSINRVTIHKKLGSPYADSAHLLISGERIKEFKCYVWPPIGPIMDTFPEEIGYLTDVTHLKICGNVKHLPVSIKNLTKLEDLDLSSNRLSKFPDEILELTNLKTLNIRSNNLDSLPESIGNLINLEYLNLEDNKLIKIPNGIGKLVKLREFYIGFNKISVLPDSIVHITKIENINVYANSICSLPGNVSRWLDSMFLKSDQNSFSNWQLSQCTDCPSGQVICGSGIIPRKHICSKIENDVDNFSTIFDLRGKRIKIDMANKPFKSLPKGCYIIKNTMQACKRIMVP